MEYMLANWPIWAVLIFVFLTASLPNVLKSIDFIYAKWLPLRTFEKGLAAKREQDRIDRLDDITEREIIAQEQLAKSQIMMLDQLNEYRRDHLTMLAGLKEANLSLAILIERSTRHRKDFKEGEQK